MNAPHQPSQIPRLWFDGASGIARSTGVTVDLTHLPRIEGMPEHLRAIDFCQSMRVAMVRESGQAWREMTPAERLAALGFLGRIADAVRGVVA